MLTDRQFELIQASLLGDGSLRKVDPRHKIPYFAESHSVNQQKYTLWKYGQLKPLSSYLGWSKTQNSISFSTKSCSDLIPLEKMWYLRDREGKYVLRNNKRIKCVPPDIDLTKFMVAVWYFDDGHLDLKHRNATIHTNCFSLSECKILSIKLNECCGISSHVREDKRPNGTFQPIIYIGSPCLIKFINCISEYLPSDDLKYKVDLKNYKSPMSNSELWENNLKPWIDQGNLLGEKNKNSKLKHKDVEEIFLLYREKISMAEIARRFNVSHANISSILKGKHWKQVNLG